MVSDTHTRGDLAALLARVEGAERPDRKLDAEIWCAVLGYSDPSWKGRSFVEDCWSYGYTYALNGERRSSTAGEHTRLTASLDAALALCERVLPGWMVENLGELSPECQPVAGKWLAQLRPRQPRRRMGGAITAENLLATFDAADPAGGETPALALLAATLRALIAQQETQV